MTDLHTAAGQFVATIQEPQTADTYRWALDALERFLVYGDEIEKDLGPGHRPPYPVEDLQTGDLEAFYLWMQERYAKQSIHTYLSAVRRFLRWLNARDQLPETFRLSKALDRLEEALGQHRQSYKHRRIDPALPEIVLYYDKLQLPEVPPEGQGEDWKSRKSRKSRNSWKTRQDRLILLRNRAIVHTLYASGGRVSEVASLTKEMVLGGRLSEAHLQGKGGYSRVILFTPEAMTAIRAYLKERNDSYPALFISHGRNLGNPLSRYTIWRVVKHAARA
ncbi:MAG: tyrosine-type recombinase/integrase, partial [Anaerolineae bacterium]|nr:tyrosine-type recombinase/integrase [Anaerolineae bacterium]